ncbi:hypothetical protein C4569_03395 [Candidatus Parcubacteria bacterium]|nr:MAG: hypothetical protein C4569_03395 [Candidatus Parcubacteria bacterium]
MSKTLYLWDLAGTLFYEEWDIKKTGYPAIGDWIAAKLKKKKSEVTDREYEEMHRFAYEHGWPIKLALKPGFKEVLIWTKHNETFSTGMQEQMAWRAKYLNPKAGCDIRKFFQKFNSTFDYGETNKKTKEMLINYLGKKYRQGYRTVLYIDDKLSNCKFFISAVKSMQKRHKGLKYRLYHILNDKKGIRKKRGYFEIGRLTDIINNEKKLTSTL